jgi:hypothetical protein
MLPWFGNTQSSGKAGLRPVLICYYNDMKYILFALALIISPFTSVSAQADLSFGNSEIKIDLEPAFPEPNSSFRASLNDYAFPMQVTSISWRVDGETLPDNSNQRTLSLVAKEAGESTSIEALIKIAGGSDVLVRKIVSPINVDIIVEPQTKTPAFYKGRALPSVGSTVNLTALLNGIRIPDAGFIYTWKVNSQVVNGGSVIGNNRSSITIPLGQLVIISVDIKKTDGTLVVSKAVEIPSVTPTFYFYELSTLYGLNNIALKEVNFIGDVITVRAEPYYLDINTFNRPGHLEWKVDGMINNSSTANPYEITLARTGVFTGRSMVDIHVRNLEQLLQGAKGEFQVNF